MLDSCLRGNDEISQTHVIPAKAGIQEPLPDLLRCYFPRFGTSMIMKTLERGGMKDDLSLPTVKYLTQRQLPTRIPPRLHTYRVSEKDFGAMDFWKIFSAVLHGS